MRVRASLTSRTMSLPRRILTIPLLYTSKRPITPLRGSGLGASDGTVDAVLEVAGVASTGGLTSGPNETFLVPSVISTSSLSDGLGVGRNVGNGDGNWNRYRRSSLDDPSSC